ncbi:hypothetical protein [Streptomyces huiliensis]|uniref:hypothetical protein n=1 Tax=Streptomyces huiliensis TaxID=2876027 RepID=UPI001CBEF85D|nr:hypothetical protein [Streptomyces huiliensis]
MGPPGAGLPVSFGGVLTGGLRAGGTAEEWSALLDAAPPGDASMRHVVVLVGRAPGTGPAAPAAHAARTITSLGALAAARGRRDFGPGPKPWLVTHPHDALPGPVRIPTRPPPPSGAPPAPSPTSTRTWTPAGSP